MHAMLPDLHPYGINFVNCFEGLMMVDMQKTKESPKNFFPGPRIWPSSLLPYLCHNTSRVPMPCMRVMAWVGSYMDIGNFSTCVLTLKMEKVQVIEFPEWKQQ